jgi:chloramphenicol 3-O phosphotransferase
MAEPGRIVILNGAPRSGKSSIVRVIQESFDGAWMNLGVDVFARQVTPPKLQPGIGLRPGGERPDVEELVPALYAALYDSVAAHSRHGLDVVVDVGHHDAYSKPRHTLADAARRLDGLPALLVGVRCSLDAIMHRREGGQPDRDGQYVVRGSDGTIPEPVLLWQREVHTPGIYDLEVDTDAMTPSECAAAIRRRLESGRPPSALTRIRRDG